MKPFEVRQHYDIIRRSSVKVPFEMFQGTFVCVSLEYEQGRVSCVIRPGNVERFFGFCGALSPEIVVDGISLETSLQVTVTLAHWPSAKLLLLLPIGEPKFVNVFLLKKNIVTFVLTMSSSFFTLCTDESMCAMRSALLNVEIDFHVRLDICISFDDSFIVSAGTNGLDWKTHELPKCS